jgi:hypothetical protein
VRRVQFLAVGLVLSLMLFAAVGCAITSGYARGPNGQPVYYIDGMSAGVAYRKADQKCPNGYTIIGGGTQTSVADYVMTIECKAVR